MDYDNVLRLVSEALMLCLVLSLPAVVTSSVVGLAVAFFSAVTSLQDQSISQSIKLLAVAVVVLIASGWAGATMLQFANTVFTMVFGA